MDSTEEIEKLLDDLRGEDLEDEEISKILETRPDADADQTGSSDDEYETGSDDDAEKPSKLPDFLGFEDEEMSKMIENLTPEEAAALFVTLSDSDADKTGGSDDEYKTDSDDDAGETSKLSDVLCCEEEISNMIENLTPEEAAALLVTMSDSDADKTGSEYETDSDDDAEESSKLSDIVLCVEEEISKMIENLTPEETAALLVTMSDSDADKTVNSDDDYETASDDDDGTTFNVILKEAATLHATIPDADTDKTVNSDDDYVTDSDDDDGTSNMILKDVEIIENLTPEKASTLHATMPDAAVNSDDDYETDSEDDGTTSNMILKDVRITSIIPSGFIWIQRQTDELSYVLNMKPKVNLRQVLTTEVMRRIRELRRRGVTNFMVRNGDQFRRVEILCKVDQPRSTLLNILPLPIRKNGDVGEPRDQQVVVAYLDVGTRELLPISKLIPPEYFDDCYSPENIEPQCTEALLTSEGPDELILSEEEMQYYLKNASTIEVLDPGYDKDLPLVMVHFKKRQAKRIWCNGS